MVHTLRAIYDGWREGDFNARLDLFEPDAVLVINPEFPDAGTYAGRDEIARYMRQFLEPWVRLTIEPGEVVTGDDAVIVGVNQVGTGRESGVATELGYFQVWTLRGDKVVRLELIRERADALEAAGLAQ